MASGYQHYRWIDALRGFAVAAIVFIHGVVSESQ